MKKAILNISSIAAVAVVLLMAGCSGRAPETATRMNATIGLDKGFMAPELAFPNPEGDTIALSSLHGKLVLIDFWASWCLPCHIENPNLVKVYNTYKNRRFSNGNGFTIYSVSLDTKIDAWTDAIDRDGLLWENHVSDLKGWYSIPAAIYQVSSIPFNLLIDGRGIIIAKNLRGVKLGETLESLLK
jgi:thiol-disulfide isomerase/thioredoxin